MEIKFEVTQEMYVLLGRIEERINTLKIVLDVSEEEKNVGDGLLSCADWDEILDSLYPDTPKLKRFDYADVDEIYNIGEYAERILSYVRASGDKDMMLECCKVDRDVLHRLMALIEDKRAIASLLKCVGCLFNIHNMALEKIWGINEEDIENCKYCIDIYGKCYLMNDDEKVICLIPKPGEEDRIPQKQMPDVLNTNEALKYWEKAKELGFVDEDFKFIGTKYQMAYFAELMGTKLNLKHKWKPFTELWGYNKFAQTRHESKERFGVVADSKRIESIFE